MPNFHNKQPVFTDGQVITEGNYSQLLPNTEIAVGVKGLIIEGGNFLNCKLPADATINGGLHVQRDSCYHLHPELDLPVEDANCKHVTDTIDVDGLTVYVREDL